MTTTTNTFIKIPGNIDPTDYDKEIQIRSRLHAFYISK